jgi:hypothetical protein
MYTGKDAFSRGRLIDIELKRANPSGIAMPIPLVLEKNPPFPVRRSTSAKETAMLY